MRSWRGSHTVGRNRLEARDPFSSTSDAFSIFGRHFRDLRTSRTPSRAAKRPRATLTPCLIGLAARGKHRKILRRPPPRRCFASFRASKPPHEFLFWRTHEVSISITIKLSPRPPTPLLHHSWPAGRRDIDWPCATVIAVLEALFARPSPNAVSQPCSAASISSFGTPSRPRERPTRQRHRPTAVESATGF